MTQKSDKPVLVSINYKMRTDDKSSLAQYQTVQEAINFMMQLDREQIEYIGLTDGYGVQVSFFDKIIETYDKHSDLWRGEKYCLHTNIKYPSGGGIHCKTCGAWFCY